MQQQIEITYSTHIFLAEGIQYTKKIVTKYFLDCKSAYFFSQTTVLDD